MLRKSFAGRKLVARVEPSRLSPSTLLAAIRYAYFKKLDYFSTECIYYPNAYRGYAREYLRELEQIRPSAVIDIIHSGEALRVGTQVKRAEQTQCKRCGYMSSNELCKACRAYSGGSWAGCSVVCYAWRPHTDIGIFRPLASTLDAAVLLEGLNRGTPSLGIHSSKSRYAREARKDDVGPDDETNIGHKIPRFQRPQMLSPPAELQRVPQA